MTTYINRFKQLFPGRELPTPSNDPPTHTGEPCDRDRQILEVEDLELQQEFEGIVRTSLRAPAPVAGSELTLELVKVITSNKPETVSPLVTKYSPPYFVDSYFSFLEDELKMDITGAQKEGLLRTWDRVTNWVIYAKYHHARPRPAALAKHYDLTLPYVEFPDDWNSTPAYPSLRASLVVSAASYLSHSHPQYYPVLEKKLVDVSGYLTRSGLNYYSDIQAVWSLLRDNVLTADRLAIKKRRESKEKVKTRSKIKKARRARR